MRRITISLPDEVAAILAIEARRLHRPIPDIVREAVTNHLGLGSDGERRELPFANLGASGHRDTSLQVDSLLAEAWTNELGAHHRSLDACMRRITVWLPEDVAELLDVEAARQQRAVSDIVHEAVVRFLEVDEERSRDIPFAALFDSDQLTPGSMVSSELERSWADALQER